MRRLGWSVEEHGFDDNTPHGRKRLANQYSILKPSRALKAAIALKTNLFSHLVDNNFLPKALHIFIVLF